MIDADLHDAVFSSDDQRHQVRQHPSFRPGPGARFYTDKLGFKILTDKPFDGKQRWNELSIPGADTGVVLFTADAHKDRIGTFSGISFHCQDLQKTYDELVAQGVEFAGPPKKEPWGSFVIVRDPDGNQFVLSAR